MAVGVLRAFRPENAVKNAYYAAVRRLDRKVKDKSEKATTAAAAVLAELASMGSGSSAQKSPRAVRKSTASRASPVKKRHCDDDADSVPDTASVAPDSPRHSSAAFDPADDGDSDVSSPLKRSRADA